MPYFYFQRSFDSHPRPVKSRYNPLDRLSPIPIVGKVHEITEEQYEDLSLQDLVDALNTAAAKDATASF